MKMIKVVNFKIWKTIRLGTDENVDMLRQTLKKGGYNIGKWADDILGRPAFTISGLETDINLVIASGRELGLKNNATRKEIYDRGLQHKLKLCPAEAGSQLRRPISKSTNGRSATHCHETNYRLRR